MPPLNLHVSPTQLCTANQTLVVDKVATLIGANGSGKSGVLQSLFRDRLSGAHNSNLRIVCFSSGQNENFSPAFSRYLAARRKSEAAIGLDCFYYDKTWSKLLIFLATCTQEKGHVRRFLVDHHYVEETAISESRLDDAHSALQLKFRVPWPYVARAKQAATIEESGETTSTLRATPYFQSLQSFITTIVSSEYAFENTMRKRAVTLKSDTLFKVNYSNASDSSLSPLVSFFTQACDNNYFIDRYSFRLTFKGSLEMDRLSDGEYQLLFLYALIDLFDGDNTLFLLDEADSHLHYENIGRLWKILATIQGRVVSTTHLLDSITANTFEAIRVVERGTISEDDKLRQLLNRLSVLSKATSVKYDVCARVGRLALLDDYNDWKIFLKLAEKKGLDLSQLSNVSAVKETSSYSTNNDYFGEAKLRWVESFSKIAADITTTRIFLICDRDELAQVEFDVATGVKVNGKKYKERIDAIKWPQNKQVKVHLLAWKRRDIKSYLLSYTALQHYGKLQEINNETLAQASHLAPNNPADNEHVRKLDCKVTIDPLINDDGAGFSSTKLAALVALIPASEISADIENMFNFIVANQA